MKEKHRAVMATLSGIGFMLVLIFVVMFYLSIGFGCSNMSEMLGNCHYHEEVPDASVTFDQDESEFDNRYDVTVTINEKVNGDYFVVRSSKKKHTVNTQLTDKKPSEVKYYRRSLISDLGYDYNYTNNKDKGSIVILISEGDSATYHNLSQEDTIELFGSYNDSYELSYIETYELKNSTTSYKLNSDYKYLKKPIWERSPVWWIRQLPF